jgi:hypothetical protein
LLTGELSIEQQCNRRGRSGPRAIRTNGFGQSSDPESHAPCGTLGDEGAESGDDCRRE